MAKESKCTVAPILADTVKAEPPDDDDDLEAVEYPAAARVPKTAMERKAWVLKKRLPVHSTPLPGSPLFSDDGGGIFLDGYGRSVTI